MEVLVAVVLGFGFGFVLHRIGAADPQFIIDMLRLKNLHLMKAIFLGIGCSSLLLFCLLATGLLSSGHLSVKGAYVGVILGGGMLGAGWAVTGFCPGTGLVAAGGGRKDALFFVVGGLLGALLYMLSYARLKGTILFENLGGKATLAATGAANYEAIFPSIPGILVAGGIALLFIGIAWILPQHR